MDFISCVHLRNYINQVIMLTQHEVDVSPFSSSFTFLSQFTAETSQWQTELTKDELIEKLSTTTKSADHLNELLRESEATNAILMEQIKVSRHAVNVGTAVICMVYFLNEMFNTESVSENGSLQKFGNTKLYFEGFFKFTRVVITSKAYLRIFFPSFSYLGEEGK